VRENVLRTYGKQLVVRIVAFVLCLLCAHNVDAIGQHYKSSLSQEAIYNAEYFLLTYDQKIKLVNGSFEQKGGYLKVQIVRYAVGDLIGKSTEDTAVILVSTGGGSGSFYELIVLTNKEGVPSQGASCELGDRIIINSLTIKSQEIIIDMVKHREDDGLCCPTENIVATFVIKNGELSLKSCVPKGYACDSLADS